MTFKSKIITEEEYLAMISDSEADEPEEKVIFWDSVEARIMVWTLWDVEEEEIEEDSDDEPEEEPKPKRRWLF